MTRALPQQPGKTIRQHRSLTGAARVAWWCVAVLAMTAGVLHAQDAQPVNLQPRWTPGQTSRYEVWTLRQQQTSTRAGAESRQFNTAMEVAGVVAWQVNKVAGDGSSQCTMTVEWLSTDVTLPDGSVQRNDSRKARGDIEQVHGLLRAMVGVPLQVDVAADGTVRSVKGTDAIRRRVPQGVPAPDDRDFIESATELAVLAGAPAAALPGKSWDNRFTWSHNMGQQPLSIRQTLDNVEDVEGVPVATVTGSGSVKLEIERPPSEPGGPRIDTKQTLGTYESQTMFDLQRHEAVGRNSTTRIGVTINVSIMGRSITSTLQETVQSQALRTSEE